MQHHRTPFGLLWIQEASYPISVGSDAPSPSFSSSSSSSSFCHHHCPSRSCRPERHNKHSYATAASKYEAREVIWLANSAECAARLTVVCSSTWRAMTTASCSLLSRNTRHQILPDVYLDGSDRDENKWGRKTTTIKWLEWGYICPSRPAELLLVKERRRLIPGMELKPFH